MTNIIQIKSTHPGVYEDLVTMQNHINDMTKMLGGAQPPVAAGGIVVSAANGVIDVSIIDKQPQPGEDYFLEYDTVPAFTNAHVRPLMASRNDRIATLAGQTTYWRWYKSTKLGGFSDRIAYGNPPTPVTPGNISASPGPVPAPTQGSGQSQQPGYGWHSVGDRPRTPTK